MKGLERLTMTFLDYAEDMAYEQKVMTMNDWINATDELLKFRKKTSFKSCWENILSAGCRKSKPGV